MSCDKGVPAPCTMVRDRILNDAHYRSLLQKAVRRGNVDLVITVSALLEAISVKARAWFRTRAAVITFEECWPLGTDLIFNRRFHSKVAALVKVARCEKARDAAGLGALAHAFSLGERSVLTGDPADRHIKIVAGAIERPEDFWRWIDGRKANPAQKLLIEHARRFQSAGKPSDRAVIKAAAYLTVAESIRAPQTAPPVSAAFPYWVAFDNHTRQGRRVLMDVARDLHIPLPQLEWAFCYFESCRANAAGISPWWERLCRWRFAKVGLEMEEARLVWEPARPQVKKALKEDSRRLHRHLYQWKITHLDRNDSLKSQVELFLTHFDRVKINQMEMF